ncbi:hypothetical protein DPMN_183786 [Dreissena polymorpha]|uniref:Uncharacterized protein n=1 Tax=Dreissena polymorpha TaxID=45954 RepID=A0A9D4I5S5_DREPO|nr:hypothetical protein DPMN_183786 [Dreissena polymorpha]
MTSPPNRQADFNQIAQFNICYVTSASGLNSNLFKSNPATTLTTCLDQTAVSVRTISAQKAVDDSPCLLKVEVEEEVRSLKAVKSPGLDNFLSELIICEYDPK